MIFPDANFRMLERCMLFIKIANVVFPFGTLYDYSLISEFYSYIKYIPHAKSKGCCFADLQ